MSRSDTAKKIAATNRRRHGADFYKRISKLGVAARRNPYHHFAYLKQNDPEKLKQIGRQYGRGHAKLTKKEK